MVSACAELVRECSVTARFGKSVSVNYNLCCISVCWVLLCNVSWTARKGEPTLGAPILTWRQRRNSWSDAVSSIRSDERVETALGVGGGLILMWGADFICSVKLGTAEFRPLNWWYHWMRILYTISVCLSACLDSAQGFWRNWSVHNIKSQGINVWRPVSFVSCGLTNKVDKEGWCFVCLVLPACCSRKKIKYFIFLL
jgi:hypothetical protein